MAKVKKIKVINNLPAGALGLNLVNGKKFVLRNPDNFTQITPEDVWHIFNSCKTIQKGYLYIDDSVMRVELGLEEEDFIDINALSRDELKSIINDYDISELKEVFQSDLSDGTKEKIAILAREQYKTSTLDAKKLKLIEQETGLAIVEQDGSDIEDVNDIKEKKKVKKTKNKKTDK